MSIFLYNISAITADENHTFLKDVSIGIKDGIIDYLGEGSMDLGKNYDEIIDCKDMLAMPGLVNAHNHAAMAMFRNYADDMKLMDWLFNRIFPLEEKFTPEGVYWGSALAILEMLRSGTTAFCDMYMFNEKTAEVVIKSGIKASLGRGLQGEKADKNDYRIQENLELFEKYHNTNEGRLRINLGPHSVYTCSFEYLGMIAKIAQEKDIAIHIHLSETEDEVKNCIDKYGMTPIKLADKAGLLNKNTIAAHCVFIDKEDIEILKKHQVNVAHNPSSNMKLASGIAPIKELIDSGINVALGTDSASSNNNQDMLREMRTASYLQKVHLKDPTALPVDQVIKMATVNGASALCFENTGMIKEGMDADIIIFDTNKPHYYPKYNHKSALLYSGNSTDIEIVIIDGRIIMRDNEILTMDEEKILYEVQNLSKDF